MERVSNMVGRSLNINASTEGERESINRLLTFFEEGGRQRVAELVYCWAGRTARRKGGKRRFAQKRRDPRVLAAKRSGGKKGGVSPLSPERCADGDFILREEPALREREKRTGSSTFCLSRAETFTNVVRKAKKKGVGGDVPPPDCKLRARGKGSVEIRYPGGGKMSSYDREFRRKKW